MPRLWADPANPFHTPIHPALTSFTDELCAAVARIFLYVGTLALLAIFTLHGWDRLRAMAGDASFQVGWSAAGRARPAFAFDGTVPSKASVTYTVLRHALGGRKDTLRSVAGDDMVVAELEIYRPGGEFNPSRSPEAGLAARMGVTPPRLADAGIVDSKFGAVELMAGPAPAATPAACLGFVKRIAEPHLQISGWSCQGDSLPARRTAIGCMLDRLVLRGAAREPKLAALFARAEVDRRDCAAGPADWIGGEEAPLLRGSL